MSYFDRDQVLKAIRLQPGGRFRRDPAEVAASLRAHYEGQCFFAVRVAARFDPEAGRLTLTVDEGRMHRLVLDGLEGDEEARIRAALGIEPGTPLRDKEVRDAMGRLEAATGGAYRIEGGPPWTVEEGPEGPTLRLRIVHRRFRVRAAAERAGQLAVPHPGGGHGRRASGSTSPSSAALPPTTRASTSAAPMRSAPTCARYAVGIRRSFGPDHLVTAGYERHDMTDTDDLFRRLPIEGPRRRPIVFHITDEYFHRRGDEAYLFLRPTPRAHLGVSFRSDRHESMPVIEDDWIAVLLAEPAARTPPSARAGCARCSSPRAGRTASRCSRTGSTSRTPSSCARSTARRSSTPRARASRRRTRSPTKGSAATSRSSG